MENKDLIQSKIDEALLNFKKARYQNAIDILEKLDEKETNFLICWYLGHSYFRINDYFSAIKYIDQVLIFNNRKHLEDLIKLYSPDIILLGNDWEMEMLLVESMPKKLDFFPGMVDTLVLKLLRK